MKRRLFLLASLLALVTAGCASHSPPAPIPISTPSITHHNERIQGPRGAFTIVLPDDAVLANKSTTPPSAEGIETTYTYQVSSPKCVISLQTLDLGASATTDYSLACSLVVARAAKAKLAELSRVYRLVDSTVTDDYHCPAFTYHEVIHRAGKSDIYQHGVELIRGKVLYGMAVAATDPHTPDGPFAIQLFQSLKAPGSDHALVASNVDDTLHRISQETGLSQVRLPPGATTREAADQVSYLKPDCSFCMLVGTCSAEPRSEVKAVMTSGTYRQLQRHKALFYTRMPHDLQVGGHPAVSVEYTIGISPCRLLVVKGEKKSLEISIMGTGSERDVVSLLAQLH